MTAQKWLELYAKDKKKFALELAKVLVPGPWKHNWMWHTRLNKFQCSKCDEKDSGPNYTSICPHPNSIDIKDWNTAEKYAREVHALRFRAALIRIFDIVRPDGNFDAWVLFGVQSHEKLIAAAMAAEGSKT